MRDERRLRTIRVPATAGPGSAQITTAPVRLCGWTLSCGDVTNQSATGMQAAPAAGTTICSVASAPAGQYTVQWSVALSGTLALADTNNLGLYVGGVLVATSVDNALAGPYPQVPVTVTIPAGGATVSIQSIGASTAGSFYRAQFVLGGGPNAEGYISSGADILMVFGIKPGIAETEIIGGEGIYVTSDLTVHVNTGTVNGSLIVDFNHV